MVFASSTFTDTQSERNILLEKIQPRLRQIGRQHGIDVMIVDMRWGIRDESTLNHGTWEECRKAIDRCREDSNGMFFLSLQSDKYGYRPLPKYVSEIDLRTKISSADAVVQDMASKWYILDMNSIPVKNTLRNLETTKNNDYWNVVLPGLRNCLEGICLEADGCSTLVVGRSVTEWETMYSLAQDSSLDRCVWVQRSFIGGVSAELDEAGNYFDRNDPSSLPLLLRLRTWMTNRVPADRRQVFSDITAQSMLSRTAAWTTYLDNWEKLLQSRLEAELHEIIEEKYGWNIDGSGQGIEGPVLSDILHHYAWAFRNCANFVGCESLIAECMNTARAVNAYGVALAVVGASGTGKTALMAKLAQQLYEAESRTHDAMLGAGNGGRPVIIRFCGTNSESSSGLGLVRSVCHQLLYLRSLREPGLERTYVPTSYDDAVILLHELLSTNAVILLIDSLDQLSDENLARSRLSFLKGVRPHKDTLIMVSTLLDQLEDGRAGSTFLGCETRLREANTRKVFVGQVGSESDGHIQRDMIENMLKKNGRTLQARQWRIVDNALPLEPTALYIHLVVGIIENWRSTEVEDTLLLYSSADEIIALIFDNVEKLYGRKLVRAALALITYSVAGISDNEMEDLLSLDERVLDDVFQYHTPTTRRLPSHVWLRIRDALTGLIAERDGTCVVWYHRQLQETAERRYVDEQHSSHNHMARYFGDLVNPNERCPKRISSQPLVLSEESVWLKETNVNLRRCVEAGCHLIKAGMLKEAADEMCSSDKICGMVKVGLGFSLIENMVTLHELVSKSPSFHPEAKTRVYDYMKWLRQSMTTIVQNPASFIPDSCTAMLPQSSRARQDMVNILTKQLDSNRSFRNCSVVSSAFSFAIAPQDNDETLLLTLEGHSGCIGSLSWSPDNRNIVSASKDNTIRIWNASTGRVQTVLEGHESNVPCAMFSHDGKQIVSASHDKTIRFWDASTGSQLKVIFGHSDAIRSVQFSSDDLRILTGSRDRTIRIWDTVHGMQLTVIDCKDEATSTCWCPDGSQIASGQGIVVNIWDSKTGWLVTQLGDHPGKVGFVSWSPSGDRLAVASKDVRIWDVTSCNLVATLVGSSNCIAWRPDGCKIAVGGSSTCLNIWNALTGVLCSKLRSVSGIGVSSVRWSNDGHKLAAGESTEGNILVWDTSVDEPLTNDPTVCRYLTVSWNSDTSILVTSDVRRDEYDVKTGQTSQKLSISSGYASPIAPTKWSPDGQFVASISRSHAISIVATASDQVLHTFSYSNAKNGEMAWRFDSTRIACQANNKIVYILDIPTGREVARCEGNTSFVSCISWSPCGEYVVSTSSAQNEPTCVWEGYSGKCVAAMRIEDYVPCACWSPSGDLLALCSRTSGIVLVDSTSWSMTGKVLAGNINAYGVAWSSTGCKLAAMYWTHSSPGTLPGIAQTGIAVLDVATATVAMTLACVSGVVSVAWNPSGTLLASSSKDGLVRIWSCWRQDNGPIAVTLPAPAILRKFLCSPIHDLSLALIHS
jgi:WD40 repeat protein